MIKNKYAKFTVFMICYLLFWNLLSRLISGSSYQFKMNSDLFMPLVSGIVIGCVLFLRKGSDE